MTKNGRRVLFLLVATVANMLLTVIFIIVLFVGLNALALGIGLKNASVPIIGVSFLAGVVAAGFIYGRALKAIQKRPELVERFGLLK